MFFYLGMLLELNGLVRRPGGLCGGRPVRTSGEEPFLLKVGAGVFRAGCLLE